MRSASARAEGMDTWTSIPSLTRSRHPVCHTIEHVVLPVASSVVQGRLSPSAPVAFAPFHADAGVVGSCVVHIRRCHPSLLSAQAMVAALVLVSSSTHHHHHHHHRCWNGPFHSKLYPGYGCCWLRRTACCCPFVCPHVPSNAIASNIPMYVSPSYKSCV